MTAIQCEKCGESMQAQEGKTPRLCPFCGSPYAEEADPLAPSPLDAQLSQVRDPKKKYRMIQEALSAAPDDFAVNRALLFHGRLHEPMRGRGIDFSIIKSHLLSVFETPEAYDDATLSGKYDELLRGPQLQKTMALAPDPQAFFEAYLRRLAWEYVDLFIRGDSRNSQTIFGFSRSPDSTARRCAWPVRRMLNAIRDSGRLDEKTRALLLDAVREGYLGLFPGFAGLLEGDGGR